MEKYLIFEMSTTVVMAKIIGVVPINTIAPISSQNKIFQTHLCKVSIGEKALFLENVTGKARIEIDEGTIYFVHPNCSEGDKLDSFYVTLKLNKDGSISKRNKFIMEFETPEDAELWATLSKDNYSIHARLKKWR